MQKATIYTFTVCPYCIRAKQLLNRKGVPFDEINITDNDDKLQELTKKTGMHTVPQIWIGETFVGGCDDLHQLDASGKLDVLIN